MNKLALGVDIGATNTRVAIGDLSGILFKTSEKTVNKGDEYTVAEQIIKLAEKIPEKLIRRIAGVGIGSIGPINIRRGVIVNPPNLPFKKVFVVEPLIDRFRVPVYLVNDCVAAVIGEKFFGAGGKVDNLVYVTISTGIGCGAYVNGNLLLGKDGNAHEAGHMVVDFRGRLKCGCGGRGHWEAYCSGRNIPNYAKLILRKIGKVGVKESSLYRDFENLTSEAVFLNARMGDYLALKIVREIGRLNAIGFANIVNMYDPSLITVGGALILRNIDLTIPIIRRSIVRYTINRIPRIIPTPLGEDAVLYGAIALALNPPVQLQKLAKTSSQI